METVILTIEVTPELDKALQDIADRDLVTKEDVARGILSVSLAQARNRGLELLVKFAHPIELFIESKRIGGKRYYIAKTARIDKG